MYNIASEESYSDGQLIFKEGSSGDWVYVIVEGSVEIFKTVKEKKVVIELLGEGEVFGELGFLGGIKRTASARAVGDTVLGVIDRNFLDSEFNNLTSDFRKILVAVVGRFKKMLDRANDFTRRKEARTQKTLSLSFKEKASFIKAYSDNISGGGLFIRTKSPLNQGDPFTLKLQLPGMDEPLKIDCEVCWSRPEPEEAGSSPAGMGIQFSDMSDGDRETLDQFIKEVSAGADTPG